MNVKELIEKLKEFPQKTPVMLFESEVGEILEINEGDIAYCDVFEDLNYEYSFFNHNNNQKTKALLLNINWDVRNNSKTGKTPKI